MKDPHNRSKYVKVDGRADEQEILRRQDNADAVEQGEQKQNAKGKKPKYSGAYYFVDKDETKLATMSFIRTLLTVSALIFQIVALLLPAQDGAMYVSKHIGSYALFYVMFTIFGMLGVSIWLLVMNQIRYKIQKRIIAEHAPKNGFKNRAYFGQELYMAIMSVMTAFYLSFVCIRFDGWGLGVLFISLASLAAAVAARQITHMTLKDAELIPAPDDEN